jgi:glucose-6-phosphate 1-dehydrogenase
MSNPFREELVSQARSEVCTVVILGATGDLTHRKLVPALYNLAAEGELPPGVKIVGMARRDWSDEYFRDSLEKINREVSRSGHCEELWGEFRECVSYHCSEFQDAEGYRKLSERLDEIDRERGGAGNRLFYVASAPEFFDDIL